ncbi:MAG: phage tail sheath subtilisin-like domain-containing protein [Holophagaceae bacterium]|nr:phage tail sheath subtilisin-like domain-containing protein [Holophagaceae bacterium]
MPEYLAPGVFVEETSFRSQAIQGIDTTTAAFVGPTRKGPYGNRPSLLTSLVDFQRIYGSFADLLVSGPAELKRNHVAHAVQAYFANGGRRLYVARTRPNRTRTLPTPADYAAALATLQPLEDLSTVAAPGYSVRKATEPTAREAIQGQLVAFAEQAGTYRFAVLDAPPACTLSDIRGIRSRLDSSHAALYYPWVTVANPLAGTSSKQPATLDLPPSGFLCGIYAATDLARSVSKAPANAVIVGALGLEQAITLGQQEILNPEGINCLRFFEGRGNLVWGARTVSSDPEWKYLNVRRYFNYLEGSIDRGTQWAVFEPNGEALWANLRRTIEDFLYHEWQNGTLMGTKPAEAFFVRCDRSTMTQSDLDQGRLVCLIGVAPLKPAEFVIFRMGQWTADRKG